MRCVIGLFLIIMLVVCGILICMLLVGLAYIHEITATHSEGFIAVGMTLAILGLPLTYFVETISAGTHPVIYQCIIMAIAATIQISIWGLIIDSVTKMKNWNIEFYNNRVE